MLGEDRRAGAVAGPHVEEPRPGLRPKRMVVNHDVRHAARRKGVVARAGLRIEQGDQRPLVPVHARDRQQVQPQFADHRPVLGASGDRLAADAGSDSGFFFGQPLQRARACERVGVRVVVDHHQQPARLFERLQQSVHVLRHGPLLPFGPEFAAKRRKTRVHAA
jgi:hypothetical protein